MPPNPSLRHLRPTKIHQFPSLLKRPFSTTPPPASSRSPASTKHSRSRLRQLNDRLPRFLRSYTTRLLGAPITHITSFLILHEITAVVPLFGLVVAFHYGNGAWLPLPDLSNGPFGTAFDEGVKRFGRWLRTKEWVAAEDVETVTQAEQRGTISTQGAQQERAGVRLVLEFATSYAITKALLPVRIAASVWATPWFARVVVGPVSKSFGGLFATRR